LSENIQFGGKLLFAEKGKGNREKGKEGLRLPPFLLNTLEEKARQQLFLFLGLPAPSHWGCETKAFEKCLSFTAP